MDQNITLATFLKQAIMIYERMEHGNMVGMNACMYIHVSSMHDHHNNED